MFNDWERRVFVYRTVQVQYNTYQMDKIPKDIMQHNWEKVCSLEGMVHICLEPIRKFVMVKVP